MIQGRRYDLQTEFGVFDGPPMADFYVLGPRCLRLDLGAN